MYQLKQLFSVNVYRVFNIVVALMPQRILRFKIHQDGRVEETVEGFIGNACNDATKSIENALGEVKVKNKSTEAFSSNQIKNLQQFNQESNVTF